MALFCILSARTPNSAFLQTTDLGLTSQLVRDNADLHVV